MYVPPTKQLDLDCKKKPKLLYVSLCLFLCLFVSCQHFPIVYQQHQLLPSGQLAQRRNALPFFGVAVFLVEFGDISNDQHRKKQIKR